MLKKIENIASASEFKNNARFTLDLHSVPAISNSRSNNSDSLSFSSALIYLSQLKWHLKSIEHIENDEFLIGLLIDEVILNTKISMHDCKSSGINYKIINDKNLLQSSQQYQIIVSFDFDSNVYSENALTCSTEYLKRLFQKISAYSSMLSKNLYNTELNSFFINGFENNLIYEFSLIHRNLIYFVEKLTGEILIGNLKLNTDSREKQIKILQINVKL